MKTQRLFLIATTCVSLASCTTTTTTTEESPSRGDGNSSGDGDGDGDGDGSGSRDGSTSGDGDGSTSGDGDGSTSGDGDGSTSGDGDGSTNGDGDGDTNPNSGYDCDWGAPVITSLEPSTSPPGGLAVDNVPLFVSIGFDDNRYEDGMQWALDMMRSKQNPSGSGQGCTFDGSDARITFFVTSQVGGNTDALTALHRQAYEDGHELGNHTNTHDETLQMNANKGTWLEEIGLCNGYLEGLGMPHILGFRTPFLSWSSATFEAEIETSFEYDASIEHYFGANGFQWPFTLDHRPTQAYVAPTGTYPGLWELPVSELMLATSGWSAVTGLDFNMWVSKHMTKQQAMDVFKANLELRLMGGNGAAPNRAPLFFGGHTDLYAHDNTTAQDAIGGATTVEERRAAIEEFIDYALAYHPDVRVVPHAEILRWMQHPVGLDGTRGR